MSRRLAFTLLVIGLSACGNNASTNPVTMRVAVTASSAPLMDDLVIAYGQVAPQTNFERLEGNLETADQRLVDGSADWALVTHLPANSDLWSAPVGTDALAVVVHPANPVGELTRNDLRAIFRGVIHGWAEVGGEERPILVVTREAGSGARDAFAELVLGGTPVTPTARLATAPEAALNAVGQQPGAIGYVSLALIDARVRPLAIDGIAPTDDSVRSGQYPLVTTIRFIALEEPQGPVAVFLAWLRSGEGQTVVAKDYVPLSN